MLAEIGPGRATASENGQTMRSCAIKFSPMDDRVIIDKRDATALYHGWFVVAAAFLVAMYGFGLGFYGPGIYLVALKVLHGWSTAELSSAITAYYILGATLLFSRVGLLFDQLGPRTVVMMGTVALASGVVSLTR